MRSCTGLFLMLAPALVGCGNDGRPPPKTYPVTGTVVWRQGEPLRGGGIEFQPVVAAEQNSSALIDNDGKFSLATLVNGKHLEGALGGPHRVTVIPASTDHNIKVIVLPQTYTIKADGTNDFLIILDQRPSP